MKITRATSSYRILAAAAGLLAAALMLGACSGGDAAPPIVVSAISPTPTPRPSPASTSTPPPSACAVFAATADPFLLRVVNKERGLPTDYRPTDLEAIDDRWAAPGYPGQSMRGQAAGALVVMLSAADAQGVELRVRSSFRTYQVQAQTFQYWVGQLGEAQARRESAPPGHSEHQLGTTADVISQSIGWELIPEFGATAEGKWLGAHVHEYGFAISYPPDSEQVTGYIYEPWHLRYVGKDCATAWHASGQVLVRFLEPLDASR